MNIDHAATMLERAERHAIGTEPFSRVYPAMNTDDALQVARERDRRRRHAGVQHTGYKLGWTSAAMRRALGIDRPNYGSLWESMRLTAALDLDELIHPKAEPEFAFRANATLAGQHLAADDVVSAGSWAVAIEVVDPRWRSYSFTWEDNVADGSSAARYLTGPWHEPTGSAADWSLTMTWDQQERSGTGDAAMGSPAAAVAWLVRALHQAGERVQPGMIVLTGGITAPIDLAAGMTVRVASQEFGECVMTCTARTAEGP